MNDCGRLLFLSSDDVYSLLTPKKALDVCEQTLKWINEGRVKQIHSLPVMITDKDRMIPYPAYIEPLRVSGIKWLSGYRSNLAKGFPLSMAICVLNDSETGAPLAVFEGMSITSMRTAAHAGIGARYLAKPSSKTLAIIGCGFEARNHIRVMKELFEISRIQVCDINAVKRDNFVHKMRDEMGIDVKAVDDNRDTLNGADIVCEITTSKEPVVLYELVQPGTYVAGPNPRGIDPKLLSLADKWVIGNWERDLLWIEGREAFSANISKSKVYGSLDELAAGKKLGRENEKEITVMTHHGMSALDISTMHAAYEEARNKGVGKELTLF